MLGWLNPIQIWSNHNPTFGFVNILPKIGFRVFIVVNLTKLIART